MKLVVKNKEQAAKVCGQLLAEDYIKPKLLAFIDYKPPKTNKQCAYAHSIISFIAKHKQAAKEKAKKDCKVNFGVITVETCCISGNRTARLKSIADYTKQELETFIAQLEAYCAENGINYIASEEK